MAVRYQKLIEVALPLDEINAASVRRSRSGMDISTLHLWWRRPLAPPGRYCSHNS